MPHHRSYLISFLCLLLQLSPLAALQATVQLPSFDFTTAAGAQGWQADHDITRLERGAEGLRLQIAGGDPYLHGPVRNYPTNQLLWLHLRIKSETGGGAQVFYYKDAPTEAMSVRFQVTADAWQEALVPVPALGPGVRLRIDPPGTAGVCILGKLWFEERLHFTDPEWPKPELPPTREGWHRVASGSLAIDQSPRHLGAFEVLWKGRSVAIGNPQALIGYVTTNGARWLSPFKVGTELVVDAVPGPSVSVRARFTDPDAASWQIEQTFTPDTEDAIAVETVVRIDRDRSVLYLPLLTVLPGVGTHGTNKHQGLLAGVEYLENEPSSSEADLVGPASWRLVPDTAKITFPFMALQAEDHYLGLLWEPQPNVCAAHDSPDRQFNSGGHLFELLWPGSDGLNREERNLLPYRPETIRADQPCRLRAVLLAGEGRSLIPAIQHYVRRSGLPKLPAPGYSKDAYFELAAHGWLDSRIRSTNLYRHAWWPGFAPQPAADAALWMSWLSERITNSVLASRLQTAADAALGEVGRPQLNQRQIGHVRFPAPALVFGAVLDNASEARRRAESMLRAFTADGTTTYEAPSGGTDYGSTQPSREASGLTASRVFALLDAAAFSGDAKLIQTALGYLRAMNKFHGGVPRGAQTWEIPLHTPDILASAYLVRAYTLGHALTGDPELLAEAREWAWTGIPFVYLTPPTPEPVGTYSTIPVLGATGWVAPVWIGQPVQWCGLVYADALSQLSAFDPQGPWQQVAEGIAAAGIQHTWPLSDSDRQGLLPDFYLLRTQRRDGPAINPATLLASAVRLYGEAPPYTMLALPRFGVALHVPGTMALLEERTDGLAIRVNLALSRPGRVYVTGLRAEPGLRIDQQVVELNAPHQFQRAEGRLVIYLERSARIDLKYPAVASLEIRKTAAPGLLRIAWPAEASDSALEVAQPPAGSWTPAPFRAALEGTNLASYFQPSATMELFRLSRFARRLP